MRVGVLGINHKLAGLELREILAQTCQKRLAACDISSGAHSFILLSTCNRTEVYFSSEDLADTHSYLLSVLRNDVEEDFDQKLYSYFGQDCLQHLCRVTAGLDSAIIAETEIQGQVKGAYEIAQGLPYLPFELHYLFQKSLAIAKRIRTVLPVKPGLPGIEHAIFQAGQQLLAEHHNAKILFVGASAINEKTLSYLQAKGIRDIAICNRSTENGENIAKKHRIPFVHWDNLVSWPQYDWIILGTKAQHFLLTKTHQSIKKPKLIIDLGVPRNADPQLALNPMITLLNIDQINDSLDIRQNALQDSIRTAEEHIVKAIEQQMISFKEKEAHRLRLCGSICA